MNLIVVGVDGSESSLRALRFALREAAFRGASVRAVHAWQAPQSIRPGAPIPLEMPGRAAVEDDARNVLERAMTAVAGERGGTEIETVAVEGPAAPALVEAARDAELIVTGSRGHGTSANLLLGSVGRQCVCSSRCPVVIVRGVS